MKTKWYLQYNNVFVGGYSLKTGKVYFVKQKEEALSFTSLKANLFIQLHVGSEGFKAKNITFVVKESKLMMEKKNAEGCNK